MTMITLRAPSDLIDRVTNLAKSMGISRTQFICRALSHEYERVKRDKRLQTMAKDLQSLKNNRKYQDDIADWCDGPLMDE